MRSNQTNSTCLRTSSGISSKSLRLRAGSMTRRMPAPCAATTFSLMPPTGSTSPRRLISPVIAVSLRTVRSVISETNLIVALTIYAVAIMVRAVTDGLDSVDPAVRQAAAAVGYGGARRFWAVDLPLAGPVVLAGLRVTAVSTISLATVGILVGVTNLGYLFTNGLQRRIIP